MNRRDLIDALKAEDFSPYYRLADKIRFQEKEIMWISGRSWSFRISAVENAFTAD